LAKVRDGLLRSLDEIHNTLAETLDVAVVDEGWLEVETDEPDDEGEWYQTEWYQTGGHRRGQGELLLEQ